MPPLIVVGVLAIFFISLLPIPGMSRFDGVSVVGLALATLVMVAAMLGSVYLIVVRRRGRRWGDIGLRAAAPRALALAALTGAALVPAAGLVQALLGLSVEDDLLRMLAPEGFTWPGLIAAVVFLGLLTPVAEEVYFRGVLYGWLRGRWRVALAAPLSAVPFAAMHFFYPWPLMAMVGGLGLILALVYEVSGSLWPPIAIHATYNSLAITLLFATLP
jgi:membrane protease YdiL (CAAX protease family)